MYLLFAWRYFKAKKSANAINIIARVTVCVIAFATCCQLLVLSVYNGFEKIVLSLYSSFYTDIRIQPASGKLFCMNDQKLKELKALPFVKAISCTVEEKALLRHGDMQTIIRLKGVDNEYQQVSGVDEAVTKGIFDPGNTDQPGLVMGAGVQYASGIYLGDAMPSEPVTVFLPKSSSHSNDPLQSITEGNLNPKGSFSIQQDFDNEYAFTNIGFARQQLGLSNDQLSAIEIRLKPDANIMEAKNSLQQKIGNTVVVLTRNEQNDNLYKTMKTEKWAIAAILTFILIIAAFNMISSLTMLVIEKKKDIGILQSMGATQLAVKKIFMMEGLLLGMIGTVIGLLSALLICFLQIKWKFIKISGGSFLIDYFPVSISLIDILLIFISSMCIVLLASWLPAGRISNSSVNLR